MTTKLTSNAIKKVLKEKFPDVPRYSWGVTKGGSYANYPYIYYHLLPGDTNLDTEIFAFICSLDPNFFPSVKHFVISGLTTLDAWRNAQNLWHEVQRDWSLANEQFVNTRGDIGTCVLGEHMYLTLDRGRHSRPQRLELPIPNQAAQGASTWEHYVDTAIQRMQAVGVFMTYHPGRMD